MRTKREDGVALITALLILFLVSAIVVGMSWMVMSDQQPERKQSRPRAGVLRRGSGHGKNDRGHGQHVCDQGSITAANLPAITGTPPPDSGNPVSRTRSAFRPIRLVALTIPVRRADPIQCHDSTAQRVCGHAGADYSVYAASRGADRRDGAEVKLQRQIELVAIPVFQFGIFSNTDLSFFNGPPFDFGGRVHTNGNLWLAANQGPVYFRDKITVSGQVHPLQP